MEEYAAQLALKFAESIGKNSYEWANAKISQARGKKKLEEKQIIYEEIINTLLEDKLELERMAREYKELYERVTISDEDIEHLQRTIQHVVELFGSDPTVNKQKENIDLIVNLINKDTLKTMQLLGFNYKEAIGQPLTEACANAIQRNLGGSKSTVPKRKK